MHIKKGQPGKAALKVAPATSTKAYNPTYVYAPRLRTPSYMSTDANYYKTTSFKQLLDPATFAVVKGRITLSEGEHLKD